MQISITFRHMEASEAIKTHLNEKLQKIEKYLKEPIEIHAVCSTERYLHNIEINVQAKQFSAHFNEQSEDMYASIDLAIDKIEKAARRHKEKQQGGKTHTTSASN